MRVTAVRKGYFGGKIRDAGEVFDLPDALMKDGLKPSWVEPSGGASISAAEPEREIRKRGRKPKVASQIAEAPAEEDAEEATPSGNGLIDALGGPPPDWLPGDLIK